VPGAGQHDHLAPGQAGHQLAAHRRQQLVGVAVQAQDRPPGQPAGHLAARRLGGQGHDAGHQVVGGDADPHGDGPAEAVPDGDGPARPSTGRQLEGHQGVVGAAVEVVRAPPADSHGGDAAVEQGDPEVVVEAVGRTEQAAHRPAGGDDDGVLVAGAVP
jgi:hypothetical protein